MNILVLCGGRSAERDISCLSATAVIANLSPQYKPVLVRIDPSGKWTYQKDAQAFARHPKPFRFPFQDVPAHLAMGALKGLLVGARRIPIDVVFPALHGPFGEDGTVQGFLELAGLPYVGCGVLGSAVGMDKVVTKRLAKESGLPVLPYAVLEGKVGLSEARRLKLPVFVKPARLGSSIGIYKVKKMSELAPAVRRAFRFDETVIVEQGVSAREIECAVLGGGDKVEASVVGEIRPNAEFYSYEAKYLDSNGAEFFIPAEISKRRSEEVRAMSVEAFKALGCYGLARVDFFLDRDAGRIWFNEVNTLPGFTSISQYPKLWAASGLPFPKLIDRLVSLALARHRRRFRLRITRD